LQLPYIGLPPCFAWPGFVAHNVLYVLKRGATWEGPQPLPKPPILLAEAIAPPPALVRAGLDALPAMIRAAGERASRRFIEFCTANIRNCNTRSAYARAVKQFLDWCEGRRLELHEIEAITVAAYVEQLGSRTAKPTVKQHLAGIRQLFDYLTTGGILEVNPAASVRGPKYAVKRARPRCLRPRRYASC
jgi:Phage integrase, N-terminal SAM-like domain